MHKSLSELSQKRPIFYSEADFQHSLAWELHAEYEGKIRLEYPAQIYSGKTSYIDILDTRNLEKVAIELKYKTKKTSSNIKYNGEEYPLTNQSAQNQARYDFIKDIERLERFVELNANAVGYAVFVTNDSSYWNKARSTTTVDSNFRIHQGRTLTGSLKWCESAKEGTTKGRTNPINLNGTYAIEWNDFSSFSQTPKNGVFRYVLIKVTSTTAT